MHSTAPRLAIFDLDHTLLDGDTDSLWCYYLMDQGLLPSEWREANQCLEVQYRSGAISANAFSDFYARSIAAVPADQVLQVRAEFTHRCCVPRIKPGVLSLLASHRAQGDTLLLSSATSTFLCALTAQHLVFEHLLGTELECASDGSFTRRTQGVLNMREGKVTRLHAWLQALDTPRISDTLAQATFYSDSINDLPLLQAVGHAVAIDPDPQLRTTAVHRQWPIRSLL